MPFDWPRRPPMRIVDGGTRRGVSRRAARGSFTPCRRPPNCPLSFPSTTAVATVGDVVDRIRTCFGDLTTKSSWSTTALPMLAPPNGVAANWQSVTLRGCNSSISPATSASTMPFLAGLHHARGQYISVLDDDGQNPPEEIRKMYDAILRPRLRCGLRPLPDETARRPAEPRQLRSTTRWPSTCWGSLPACTSRVSRS